MNELELIAWAKDGDALSSLICKMAEKLLTTQAGSGEEPVDKDFEHYHVCARRDCHKLTHVKLSQSAPSGVIDELDMLLNILQVSGNLDKAVHEVVAPNLKRLIEKLRAKGGGNG